MQAHHRNFDVLNVRATSLKIWAKMTPNVCRKTNEDLFLEVTPKKRILWSLWEEICRQMSQIAFSGKFGEFRTKILGTLKNVLATSMYKIS